MLYNINPNIWGKSFWNVIHFITMAYPDNPSDEDKQHVMSFFKDLQFVLPCENCRNHFKSNLITYPLTDEILSSRYSFIASPIAISGLPVLLFTSLCTLTAHAIKLYLDDNISSVSG